MNFAKALAAVICLAVASPSIAGDDGRYRLPPGSFGVPVFGQRQSYPSSKEMQEARHLGWLEEAINVRSGWIDKVARITGRLDIMTAERDENNEAISYSCTGTAITDRLILTNAHCVKTSGKKRAISILFLPNFRDARRLDAVEALPVAVSPVESGEDKKLDYAILELQAPIADYDPPKFTIRDPGQGEPLVVIGHPEGQPLHLSRGRCRSDGDYPMDGNDILHGCATSQGSSGSLIFTSEGQVVGLHFLGGQTFDGRKLNRGIRMAALVKNSPLLHQTMIEKDTIEEGTSSSKPIDTEDAKTMCLLAVQSKSTVIEAIRMVDEWKRNRLFVEIDDSNLRFLILKRRDITEKKVMWGRRGQVYGEKNIFLRDDKTPLLFPPRGYPPEEYQKYLGTGQIHRMVPVVASTTRENRTEFWLGLTLIHSATQKIFFDSLRNAGFLTTETCIDVSEVQYFVDASENIEITAEEYLKEVQLNVEQIQ